MHHVLLTYAGKKVVAGLRSAIRGIRRLFIVEKGPAGATRTFPYHDDLVAERLGRRDLLRLLIPPRKAIDLAAGR
jgi:hypothetical protein